MKINQLVPTYRPQQQSVTVMPTDMSGLSSGLASASTALADAYKLRMDYKAQQSKAEMEKAAWELEDWTNSFLVNMENPNELKKYFSGTPYESTVIDIESGKTLTDSTIAQTHYKKAIDVAAANITDESARENFRISSLRNWERIEPKYQAEAKALVKKETLFTELQNLNHLFTSGKGTTSIAFNSKLDELYAGGFITKEQEADILLNYRKEESKAYLNNLLQQSLMPYAYQGASEEEMNIIINGLDLNTFEGDDGETLKNYLSEEEREDIIKKNVNKALNYSHMIKNAVSEARTEWSDEAWNRIYQTLYYGDMPAGERVDMAQEIINELIDIQARGMGKVDLGIRGIEPVDLGKPEQSDIDKMMNKLNSFVSSFAKDGNVPGSGEDQQAYMDKYLLASNIVNDPNYSKAEKKNLLVELSKEPNSITQTDFKNFIKDLNEFDYDMYHDIEQRAYRARFDPETNEEFWDSTTHTQLMGQIKEYLRASENVDWSTKRTVVDSILDNYIEDNEKINVMIDKIQDDTERFFKNTYFGSSDRFSSARNTNRFLKEIESGNMAGLIGGNPEAFQSFTTEMGMSLSKAIQRNPDEYNTTGMMLNDKGMPVFRADLLDPYGNALVAVAVEDENAPAGTVRVRVFQPHSVGNNKYDFMELTDAQAYYMSVYDSEGNTVANPFDYAGEPRSDIRREIYAYNGSTWQGNPLLLTMSIDPNEYNRSGFVNINRLQKESINEPRNENE